MGRETMGDEKLGYKNRAIKDVATEDAAADDIIVNLQPVWPHPDTGLCLHPQTLGPERGILWKPQ